MNNVTRKRILAGVLAICMVIMQIPVIPAIKASASVTSEDLQKASAKVSDKDVVMTVQGGAPTTSAELLQYLDFQSSGSSINVDTTEIDTTDLSTWNVYDRYDTNYYADASAYESATGYNTALRPYYAVTDSDGGVGATRIQDISSSNWGLAGPLKEHIYSGSDNGNAFMTFYGYYSIAGMDFCYYPAKAEGSKNVSFTVDSQNVRLHTLKQAGFLLNAGISGGKINGFALMFTFTGGTGSSDPATGLSKAELFYLSNVDVSALHGVSNGVASLSTSVTGVTLISTKTIDLSGTSYSGKWDVSNISMRVTNTHVKATMTQAGSSVTGTPEMMTLFDRDLTSTGYGGFGPIVGYTSHGCQYTSSYQYTNLKMSITNTSSIMDGFRNADFTQFTSTDKSTATKKYYVIIGDPSTTSSDCFTLSEDKAFLELLKKEKVVLITNLGITDGSQLGTDYNLVDYLGAGNVCQVTGTDATSLAAAIENIVNNVQYNEVSAASATVATTSVKGANCYLETNGYQIKTFNRRLLSTTGDTVSIVSDGLSVNASGETPTYTLIKPDSSTQVLSSDSFKVTNNATTWPSGVYTVSMKYSTGVDANSYFRVMAGYNTYLNGVAGDSGALGDHLSMKLGTVGKNTAQENTVYKSKITADMGYSLPASIEVYRDTDNNGNLDNATKLGLTTDYTYNSTTGEITVLRDSVTSDIYFVADTHKVEYELGSCSTSGTAKANSYTDYVTTFTPNSSSYTMPNSLKVAIGENIYTVEDGTAKTVGTGTIVYSKANKKLTISKNVVTDNVKVSIVCIGSVTVNKSLTHLESNGGAAATAGTDYSMTLTAQPGYRLPSSVTVVIKSNTATPEVDYVYNSESGVIRVYGERIFGAISISAAGVDQQYDVSYVHTNTSISVTTQQGEKVATHGTNYTGTLVAGQYYTLPSEISVSVGGNALAKTNYTYIQSSGAVTIPGDKIIGDLQITAIATANQYTEDCQAINGEVAKPEVKPTYLQDYSVTFTPNTSYKNPESVAVTFADSTVGVLGTNFTYDKENGVVAVSGAAIHQNFTIRYEAVLDDYNVDMQGTHMGLEGDEKAVRDRNYTVTLTPDEGYHLPNEVNVYVGDNLLAKSYITYDPEVGNTVQIAGAQITDVVRIIAVGVPDEHGVDCSGLTNITQLEAETHNKTVFAQEYVTTIQANRGYDLPNTIQVKIGEDILAADDYTYSSDTGVITVDGDKLLGELVITAAGVLQNYTVTFTGSSNISVEDTDGSGVCTYKLEHTETIIPEEYYDLPEAIEILVDTDADGSLDDEELLDANAYAYSVTSGAITLSSEAVLGNIQIRAVATPKQYQVDVEGTDGTYQKQVGTPTYLTDYNVTFTADTYYRNPEAVTVTFEDESVGVLNEDYTYNPTTGVVTIAGTVLHQNAKITYTAIDCTAPTGKIVIGEDEWNTECDVQSSTTYYPESKEITIEAEDQGNGLASIEYRIQKRGLSIQTEDDIWNVYDASNKPLIDEDGRYVVYVKITDQDDNVTSLNSNAIVVDLTNPVITGIENQSTYYQDITYQVADDDLMEVTVDGVVTQANSEGKYSIVADNKQHVIMAKDYTGNVTSITIVVAKTYRITYRPGANGAGNEKVVDRKYADVSFRLDHVLFTRTGHTQKGWSTTENGTKEYELGAEMKNDGDFTFYPVWEANPIDVVTSATGLKTAGNTPCVYGVEYQTTVIADAGSNLPDGVKVMVDGKELVPGVDYSYDPATGAIVVKGDKVTGKIEIQPVYKTAEPEQPKDATEVAINALGEYNVPTITLSKKLGIKQKFQIMLKNTKKAKVHYKSSNPKVVKVNKKGILQTGKKTGKATIVINIVKDKRIVQFVAKITVSKKIKKNYSLVKFSVKGKNPSIVLYRMIKKGKKWKVTLSHINKATKVKYSTSNKKIATVSKKGVVKAKKAGKAVITIITTKNNITNRYYCVIRVPKGKNKKMPSYLKVIH